MITIRFKELADILAEKRVCIHIASNGLDNIYRGDIINSDELFKLIVKEYGDYYVDNLDIDDDMFSMILIKPENLEEYVNYHTP